MILIKNLKSIFYYNVLARVIVSQSNKNNKKIILNRTILAGYLHVNSKNIN